MKKIKVTPDEVKIEYNRCKLLKNKKTVVKELKLSDIKYVTREEYKGKFHALTLLKKRGGSVYLINMKCENLEEVYNLLVKYHNNKNNYEITVIDIDKMEETKIA